MLELSIIDRLRLGFEGGVRTISLATVTPARGTGEAVETRIHREVHRAIAERRLAPGTKLAEDALARVFETSRARIRKVLLVLAQERVVRLERNRGAFVCTPAPEEARQVVEARRAVELHLVAAAARRTERSGTVRRLRRLVEREEAARARGDRERVLHLSGEFHLVMAEATDNRILVDFLRELVSRCYLILATYERRGHSTCPQADHSGLVDLIAAGDAEAAVAAMAAHFDHLAGTLDLTARSRRRQDLFEVFRGV
ncbi:MAG: GntR family transcriptional regulator [Alphaproteobacteria bacterium]|nr:GntR family transcriptional regulator [Alphaproteobacteria bacterium]